eukprot:scaffold415_cov362-Prasinococcus_capsulatus_cf.AAC.11
MPIASSTARRAAPRCCGGRRSRPCTTTPAAGMPCAISAERMAFASSLSTSAACSRPPVQK